jgi:hypothetical protein
MYLGKLMHLDNLSGTRKYGAWHYEDMRMQSAWRADANDKLSKIRKGNEKKLDNWKRGHRGKVEGLYNGK